MNARATTPPTHNLPPAVKRPNGSQPGTARRLVLAELQHHARNMRFTPHTTPPGISPQQLASATGLHIDKVRQAIGAMQAAGQVVNAGPTHRRPLWRLYTPPTATAQPSMTDERHLHGKGDYIPTELRAFTDRPRAIADLLDDSAEWLEWFHLENAMGAKGLEAGPGNGAPLRPIRTLEDLAQIMEAQQP